MTDLQAQVAALRSGAGMLRRPDLLTVRVTGEDRVRFLNGMLSCDVAAIPAGFARRAVKANAKGRVEGVLRVRLREEEVLLDLLEASAGRVAGELVKYVVMDDVELADASGDREVLALVGPGARAALAAAGYAAPETDLSFVDGPPVVVRDAELGVDGYELHGDASELENALSAAGVVEVSSEALDVVRVEAGVPRDGVDIDVDTMPAEARLDAVIDLTKGCYIGQEVIARAHHRGGVKHHLVGVHIDGGDAPPAGAELWPSAERARGELTSVVYSPTLSRLVGLGYVHVDHETPGTEVELRSGESRWTAKIAGLPHVV